MSIRFLTILLSLFLTSHLFKAHAFEMSAYRDPKLPFDQYDQLMHETEKYSPLNQVSAIASAQYYTGANLASATSWPSLEMLQSRFLNVRNERHLKWGRNTNFPRRISWLYPKDGCYARASMANRWFKLNGIETPGKVFAFGKLRATTAYHPRGVATWWYHVAPIVEIGGDKYVLDPSIEASRPLLLVDWLTRMGTPSEIKVAICKSGTHSPKSDCGNAKVGTSGVSSHENFLGLEWDQLKTMRKDPETLLGSRPPWAN